jgi:drug/metabolite transporter (DMT)-like permease
MTNLLFYAATVLIWGSTWLAIKFQLGPVEPVQSVAWRFLLAAALLFGWCLLSGKSLRFSRRDHLFIALQGLFLFALNYLLFYLAEGYLASGLVAVVFSTMVIFNILNGALFLGTPMDKRVLVAAGLGLAGISLVFWPELAAFDLSGTGRLGLLLSLAATYSASLGNILSARNQRHRLPVLQSNAFGMAYGALLMLGVAVLKEAPLHLELSVAYLSSLAYLALFGSVVAFGCYLSLIGRIGAERAAYVTLLFPLVALLLSTLYEGYHWSLPAVAGVPLILLGNLLALKRRPPAALPQAAAVR